MSKIRAAMEMMGRSLPGRSQNISQQVLGNPGRRQEMMGRNIPGRGAPGGLFGAVPIPKDISKLNALTKTAGIGALAGAGAADMTDGFTKAGSLENSIFANPEELGRQAAKAKMGLEEIMDKARGKAEELGQAPQLYMFQIQSGYQDEMNKQQAMMAPPEEEGLKPVSLLFSGGGEASSQHMMPDGTPMPGSNHQEYEAMMMQQRQMMAGGGTPFPDLTGDGKITQADILKGRGVYAVGGEAIGDELEGMEMTEEQAMAELEESRGEFEQLQMLADVVKKLLNEGMGEAEIVAYLKEQGLDDEDIETLFSFLQEISGQESSMEQAPQGIDQQIAGMM